MRKVTKLDKFLELKSSEHFPRWVVGGTKQIRRYTNYKISDEQKKNIKIIDSLSPITDLDKIESLLVPDLLQYYCSTCGNKYSEILEIIKDEPYETTGCLMCINCLKEGIDILSKKDL